MSLQWGASPNSKKDGTDWKNPREMIKLEKKKFIYGEILQFWLQ
jgi:hypothetical protein